MDQGGELYNNPKVRKIFEKRGFAIHPTGADASHQNGLVKRAHRTVAKGMRSFLVSSGAPIKFRRSAGRGGRTQTRQPNVARRVKFSC